MAKHKNEQNDGFYLKYKGKDYYMRYPIGVQDFEKIITGEYLYIDKTDLVYKLAKENVCFLSRPRRFGKSLLISTLQAYFQGRQDLFKNLKMESLEKEWVEYPIFRIDFANGNFSNPEELKNKIDACLGMWEREYGYDELNKNQGDRFLHVLKAAYEKTGHKAVVLIDEYDKPLLDVLGDPIEIKNREVLKGFYGTFKAADAYLRFVLLTGVTKFSQITVFSGFNQPKDISMDSHFDALCGITENELYTCFDKQIIEMATKKEKTVDEMKAILKKRYDGYHFSEQLLDVYNPFSIINVFDQMMLRDYWYASGTPTYLAKLIEGHNINVQELLSQAYDLSYFQDYKADIESPLAMLYQAGYLTIKSYDEEYEEYMLDIPNDEVRKGLITLVANGYFISTEARPDSWVKNIDRMLRRCDLEGIRDAYTSFLASIPYEANKDERAKDFETHYQYTYYIINRLLSCYTTLIEKQNSKGRADIIIESDNDIYIFEFKLDGSADEALKQIEACEYAVPYLTDRRPVHKIGVNISSETRTVSEWKVV